MHAGTVVIRLGELKHKTFFFGSLMPWCLLVSHGVVLCGCVVVLSDVSWCLFASHCLPTQDVSCCFMMSHGVLWCLMHGVSWCLMISDVF